MTRDNWDDKGLLLTIGMTGDGGGDKKWLGMTGDDWDD